MVEGPSSGSTALSRLDDWTRCRFTILGFSTGAPETRLAAACPDLLSNEPYVVCGPLPCNEAPAVPGDRVRSGGVPNFGGLHPNEPCNAAARADCPGPVTG